MTMNYPPARLPAALLPALLGLALLGGCREAEVAPAITMNDKAMSDPFAPFSDSQTYPPALTTLYLDRIAGLDQAGPNLNSVLAVNPDALKTARQVQALNKPLILRGLPILLKDNINTIDPMPTTAGSLALVENYAVEDAPLVANLRAQGAVILGKANLSQWANFRSESSTSGWSAVGGQTQNPHKGGVSPCGSSSGSGAAVAAGLAAAAIGTETNGSVICPAAMNGIVGFKPSVGLIAQDGIVPISHSQDTAGPMTRSVKDAAILTDVMSGKAGQAPLLRAVEQASLNGVRIGVLNFARSDDFPEVNANFKAALSVLEAQGAILVDIDAYDVLDGFWGARYDVLKYEFKDGLNKYLAGAPPAVKTRTLSDIIAFNKNTPQEMALFNQDILIASDALGELTTPAYVEALSMIKSQTQKNGIDRFMSEGNVAVLVAPSTAPAFIMTPDTGDDYPGGVGAGWIAAIAGYPHLTVPMGEAQGLPAGISFMSTAGGDGDVLAAGYIYEQASKAIIRPERFK